jgi:hypothetical protein
LFMGSLPLLIIVIVNPSGFHSHAGR